jgi:hypothetical protein
MFSHGTVTQSEDNMSKGYNTDPDPESQIYPKGDKPHQNAQDSEFYKMDHLPRLARPWTGHPLCVDDL